MKWFPQVMCLMLLPDHATSYGFLSWLDDAQAAMDSVDDGSTFDVHPNSEEELRKDLAVAGVEVHGADANMNDPDLNEGRVSSDDLTALSNQVSSGQGFDSTIDAEDFEDDKRSHLREEGGAEPSNDQELQKRMNRVLRNIENGGEEMLSTEAIDASVAALDRRDNDADDLLESGYIHAKPSKLNDENDDSHDDIADVHISAANIESGGASSSEDEEVVLEDASQRIANEELQDQAPVAAHPNVGVKVGPLRRKTNENWASPQDTVNENDDNRSSSRRADSQANSVVLDNAHRVISKANSSSSQVKSKAELDVEALSRQFMRMESILNSTQKYHLSEMSKSGKQGKHKKHELHSKQHSQHGVAKHAFQGSRKPAPSKKTREAASPLAGAVAIKLKSESVSAKPDTQTNQVGSKRLSHASSSPVGSVVVKLKSQESSSHIGTPQTEKTYGRSWDVAKDVSVVKDVIAMKLTIDTEVEQMPSLEVNAQTIKKLGTVARWGRSSVEVHNQTRNISFRNASHALPIVFNRSRPSRNRTSEIRHNSTKHVLNHTNSSFKPNNSTKHVLNCTNSSFKSNNSTKHVLNRTNSSRKSGTVSIKMQPEKSPDAGTQTSKKAVSIAAQRQRDSETEAVKNIGAAKSGEFLVAPQDDGLEVDVTDAISQAEDVLRVDDSVA